MNIFSFNNATTYILHECSDATLNVKYFHVRLNFEKRRHKTKYSHSRKTSYYVCSRERFKCITLQNYVFWKPSSLKIRKVWESSDLHISRSLCCYLHIIIVLCATMCFSCGSSFFSSTVVVVSLLFSLRHHAVDRKTTAKYNWEGNEDRERERNSIQEITNSIISH